jgi:hypothetical protein
VQGWPELSSHFCLGAAPQLGQETVSVFLRLSSFFIERIMRRIRLMAMVNFDRLTRFLWRFAFDLFLSALSYTRHALQELLKAALHPFGV